MEYEIDERKAQMLFRILVSVTEGPLEAMVIVVRLAQLTDCSLESRLEGEKSVSLGDMLKQMADSAFTVGEEGSGKSH